MATPQLIPQKRRGLFAGHNGVESPAYKVRATIPVIEALQAAGAIVVTDRTGPHTIHSVTLGATMPAGIVAVLVNGPP